jgi:leucyl-tRNA synthetase
MEKRGLVTREECASDARGSMVRLTDAGRAAVEAAALARPRIAELLGGSAPKKVIVVPDRLVNIVP